MTQTMKVKILFEYIFVFKEGVHDSFSLSDRHAFLLMINFGSFLFGFMVTREKKIVLVMFFFF